MAKAKTKKASGGSRKGGRGKAADALALLKQDHDKVKKAFKQFEKMEGSGREAQALAAQVIAELKLHAQVEEEIFYPAVRGAIDDDDLMNEAVVEHKSAKQLISELEGMSPDDPLFRASFTVLGEYIQHHVKEEEGEMFKKARRAKVDLMGLGEQIRARKGEAPDS